MLSGLNNILQLLLVTFHEKIKNLIVCRFASPYNFE